MIIGFDGSRAFVKDRTGTENYSYQLLKHLAKIDGSTSLTTGTENIYKVYIRSGSEVNLKEWPANFKFITINFPRLWTQVGLAIRTFIDPIDVLFVPAHTLPLVRKPGLKTVITVHDLGAEYLPGMHQLKQLLYLKWITHVQLKSATKLIAVSKATKDDLVKRVGVNPKKIEVIYEGVDRDFFKPIKGDILRDLLRQYDLEPLSYFLYVGTIQPRKNLIRLIWAFDGFNWSTSDDTKLVMVGRKGWLSDQIYKEAEEVGLEKRVKFLGFVPDQDLPALYSGAIGLILPSLFEGFGLPILEAMSCGCPVITSNTSSMPELVGNAALLIDPYDSKQIEQAMKKIFEDDTLRDRLILKGYNQVKKFSWEKCARETLKVFQNLKSSVQ